MECPVHSLHDLLKVRIGWTLQGLKNMFVKDYLTQHSVIASTKPSKEPLDSYLELFYYRLLDCHVQPFCVSFHF